MSLSTGNNSVLIVVNIRINTLIIQKAALFDICYDFDSQIRGTTSVGKTL